jgi:site-specific DNA-cytosine methylase
VSQYPDLIAYTILDAADYGVPQNRVRLIAANPATIQLIRQQPVQRVTVAAAFANAGRTLPATHLKSNTCNRDGSPCIRSVEEQAFTVTASHPLTWCDRDGSTVRCLTPAECALLQGFPSSWRLPAGSRLGIRAAGNAIPPPLSATIVRCTAIAAGLEPTLPPPIPEPTAPSQIICAVEEGETPPERTRIVSITKFKSLKRRLELLEAVVCEMRRAKIRAECPSHAS